MKRFQFDLATPDDDEQLRTIVAQTPTPGSISLCFAREPNFFESLPIEGGFSQVIVCRDTVRGCLAGFGIRSVRTRYVNGKPTPVGYLSGLRALPRYRSMGLVARGYQFFRELHQDQRTAFYLSTIAEDNAVAIKVLTSGRGGLPTYHDAGRFITRATPVPKRRRSLECHAPRLQFQKASDSPESLMELLREQGPERQFFPVYELNDRTGIQTSLPDLRLQDVWLARDENQTVAAAGTWDQRRYRQTVIQDYSRSLRRIRPIFNLAQRLRGLPGLPSVGQPLNNLPVVFPTFTASNPVCFEALLKQLIADRAGSNVDCLLVGLHESDPLSEVLVRLSGITYTTRLYLVCWDDGLEAIRQLDSRPRYLELGSL